MVSELDQLCAQRGVKLIARPGEAREETFEGMKHNWRVTLKYKGRQLTTDIFGGSMVQDVSVADVLSCLLAEASAGNMSFSEYCEEWGYTEAYMSDSEEFEKLQTMARRSHRMSQRIADQISRVFGDDQGIFEAASH